VGEAEPPRLLVDRTLGKLARWLRVLGYDTVYAPEGDAQVAHRARAEGRVVLTRRLTLASRSGLRTLAVVSQAPLEQLTEVVGRVGLLESGTPPRCMVCNTVLEPLSRAAAQDRVPPYVAAHHEVYHHCSGCGRIYWQGTHWHAIRRQVAEALTTLTNQPDQI